MQEMKYGVFIGEYYRLQRNVRVFKLKSSRIKLPSTTMSRWGRRVVAAYWVKAMKVL